jgi:hypothetical protein
MKIEIPIAKESEAYMQRVLSQYKEVNQMPSRITGRTVIHMYPQRDTRRIDDEGKLDGFIDAYLCELHIYDIENQTVFKSRGWNDEVDLTNVPSRIRIFKDLSTMITIDTPVRLLNCQSFIVSKL